MRCPQCNHNFSLSKILKSLQQNYGLIQCDNCKTMYRRMQNKHKSTFMIVAMMLTLVFAIMVLEKVIKSVIITGIIGGLMIYALSLVFDLVFSKLQKYEEISGK